MSNIVKELLERDNWNDKLLNNLISSLKEMKTTDVLPITLRYKDVTRLIKALINENINVDLCEETIMMGLEQRRKENNNVK